MLSNKTAAVNQDIADDPQEPEQIDPREYDLARAPQRPTAPTCADLRQAIATIQRHSDRNADEARAAGHRDLRTYREGISTGYRLAARYLESILAAFQLPAAATRTPEADNEPLPF